MATRETVVVNTLEEAKKHIENQCIQDMLGNGETVRSCARYFNQCTWEQEAPDLWVHRYHSQPTVSDVNAVAYVRDFSTQGLHITVAML